MKKHLAQFTLYFLTAVFAFQTVDFLPARHGVHAKTCCGRTVCQCKHAKGAFCPMLGKMTSPQGAAVKDAAVQTAGMKKACHFSGASRQAAVKTPAALPKGTCAFTTAPCASDVPRGLLPQYAKDFFFPVTSESILLMSEETVLSSPLLALPLFKGPGIDHPPRSLSFSF